MSKTGAGFRWRIFPIIKGPADPEGLADVDADLVAPEDPVAPVDADVDPVDPEALVDVAVVDATSVMPRLPRTCTKT